MKADFWHERWSQQQINFHQPEGHPALASWWPSLELAERARVLVPLCGKTPDLCTLAARGHRVTGIELSAIAARDFLAEQNLAATQDRLGAFERYRSDYGSGSIELLVGDFFAASPDTIGLFDGFYDRAALIALPESMRADYVAHLRGLLAANAPGLLITLDYDQSQMKGPPFAVSADEVATLFGGWADIECVAEGSGLGGQGMLTQRRVQTAEEAVFQIRSSNGPQRL